MKLKSTFTVELNDVDGKSKLTFTKPKINEMLKQAVGKEPEKDGKAFIKEVLGYVVEASGFHAEDGHELTLEEIRNCEDEVLTTTIIWAYIEGRNGLVSKEAVIKKISAIS